MNGTYVTSISKASSSAMNGRLVPVTDWGIRRYKPVQTGALMDRRISQWHNATLVLVRRCDMAKSIKLADDLMDVVRHEAERQSRSLAGQVSHWVRLGRAIEASGAYDHARVTAALEGRLDVTVLREDEEIAWLDGFTARMATPSAAECDWFAERRQLGRGVGLDADGKLVFAGSDPDA